MYVVSYDEMKIREKKKKKKKRKKDYLVTGSYVTH